MVGSMRGRDINTSPLPDTQARLSTYNDRNTAGHLAVSSYGVNENALSYYVSLRRVKEHVNQHSTEHFSLEKAAKVACLEARYFSKYFHQKVGVTFSCWRTLLRLAEAQKLILSADFSISHVAHAVGFEDIRSFERSFKKYTGLTPREFKKSAAPSLAQGKNLSQH